MKHVLFVLFWLSAAGSWGQVLNVDSLTNVLDKQNLSSIEKLDVYLKLCTFYNNHDNERLLFYAKKAIVIADKEDDKTWASRFNMILGVDCCINEKYDSAMIYYNKSVELAKQANDGDLQGGAYTMIGSMYSSTAQYDIALDYYFKALSCLEFTNRRKYGQALGQIGDLYRGLNNLDKAIEYLEKAKIIAEEIDYPISKASVYYNLGSVYRMKNQMDEALNYAQKSLRVSMESRNKQYEIISACLISSIYVHENNNDKALEYAHQALEVSEEFGEKGLTIAAMDALSRVYFNQKEYKKCESIANKAWKMDTLNYGASGHNLVARLLFTNIQLGNVDNAMYFFEKTNKALENKYNEKAQNNINELEIKYETEKKEIKISMLEKEKQLYTWLGIIGILLTFTLGIVLLQNIRNTKKEKQLIATRSVLDGEMNERTRLARDLHDRLGGNLSALKIGLTQSTDSLENISLKLDSCIEEIRRVAHNLMPVSLQFGLKVALQDYAAQFPNVRFHFFGDDQRIGERQEFIVYCCASELVNNSLRHSGAENINLQLVQDDKHITLTVQDDGCGFDEKNVKSGIGLKNIRDLIISCGGRIDIVTSPGNGTETTIELKTDNI